MTLNLDLNTFFDPSQFPACMIREEESPLTFTFETENKEGDKEKKQTNKKNRINIEIKRTQRIGWFKKSSCRFH